MGAKSPLGRNQARVSLLFLPFLIFGIAQANFEYRSLSTNSESDPYAHILESYAKDLTSQELHVKKRLLSKSALATPHDPTLAYKWGIVLLRLSDYGIADIREYAQCRAHLRNISPLKSYSYSKVFFVIDTWFHPPQDAIPFARQIASRKETRTPAYDFALSGQLSYSPLQSDRNLAIKISTELVSKHGRTGRPLIWLANCYYMDYRLSARISSYNMAKSIYEECIRDPKMNSEYKDDAKRSLKELRDS